MRRFRISIVEALALVALGVILVAFYRDVDDQLAAQATALSVRAQSILQAILVSFGLWLAVWIAAAYWTVGRQSPNESSGAAQPYFVVAAAATCFVANGVCLLSMGFGDFPALPMLDLLVLIGFVSTLGSRAIRSRRLLWAVATALTAGVFVYDFHLWGERIASC